MRRSPDPDLQQVRRAIREALLGSQPGWSGLTERQEGLDHPSEYDIATYLERRLSEAEEEVFERHVALCSSCAQELVLMNRAARDDAVARPRVHGSPLWRMAASLALVLGGLLGAVLAGRFVGSQVEHRVMAGLDSAFGGKASVGGVSVALLGGPSVELKDLTVRDPGGGDPLIQAPSARLEVSLESLTELSGSLELTEPIINVVRERSGRMNIDALLPNSRSMPSLLAEAASRAVTEVTITDGTLRWMDRSVGGGSEVRMADLDARVTDLGPKGPASLEARAGLESATQNVSAKGKVGPWGAGTKPRYQLTEVALKSVPMRAWPSMREAVSGGLSFSGHLETAGDTWSQITSSFSGAGELAVVSGALLGHNLIGEALEPMLADAEPRSRIAALLEATDTRFDEIRGDVRIRRAGLETNEIRVSGDGYRLVGRGALESSGRVDVAGVMVVSAELAVELIAIAPSAGMLLDDEGQLEIPVRVAGVWPAVEARVDASRLALGRLAPDALALLLRPRVYRSLFG
jgi:hypothetical protein